VEQSATAHFYITKQHIRDVHIPENKSVKKTHFNAVFMAFIAFPENSFSSSLCAALQYLLKLSA
jgi:hypothetical protein